MRQESNTINWSDSQTKQAILAAIVSSSDDAIISKDLTGRITSWNSAAENLFEYNEEEILGKNIRLLIPEERQGEEDMIVDQIRKGIRVSHFQTKRIAKSGRQIDISLTISPIKDEQGFIIGASKIARDISEQIAMEQRLNESNLELQKLNIYKDEFIAIAGHELSTPLTTVNACLQLMTQFPERTPDFIQRIERQTTRMKTLLAQLLDVARIQAGKLELDLTETTINELVNDAIETVQQSTQTHTIEFSPLANDVTVQVDSLRLAQALINLLTNAIKYSPGADKVVVSAGCDDDYFIITVQDFGNGISREHQRNIFTRFYRVKGDQAKRVTGLGMGLHITRQIVELHRGSISVESEVGSGSAFVIRIPR